MAIRGKLLVTALVATFSAAAGCTTTSPPTEAPAASTAGTAVVVPAPTAAAVATAAPALATPAVPPADAVAFFRAQEAVCARHAATAGDAAVDPARFSGAKEVRALGDGAYLVEDGEGTRLVVEPVAGLVLPASGRAGDLMPAPYGFGCPETVFVGGAGD